MGTFQFTAWPTEFRSINQYFGENRYFDYRKINAQLPGHEGIDVRVSEGSRVFTVAVGNQPAYAAITHSTEGGCGGTRG